VTCAVAESSFCCWCWHHVCDRLVAITITLSNFTNFPLSTGHQCRKNVSLFVQPKERQSGENPPSLSSSSTSSSSSSLSSSIPRSKVVGGTSADNSSRTDAINNGEGYPGDSPVSVSVSAFGFGDMMAASDTAASGLLDGPLSYLIKSVDSPPQIRITVPGKRLADKLHRSIISSLLAQFQTFGSSFRRTLITVIWVFV